MTTTQVQSRRIDIGLLDLFVFQSRKELDGLDVTAEEFTLLPSLVVRGKEGGRYEIISGHRRFAAAKRLGIREVECKVVQLDDEQASTEHYMENKRRKEFTDFEKGKFFTSQQERFGWSDTELARRFHEDRTTIGAWMREYKDYLLIARRRAKKEEERKREPQPSKDQPKSSDDPEKGDSKPAETDEKKEDRSAHDKPTDDESQTAEENYKAHLPASIYRAIKALPLPLRLEAMREVMENNFTKREARYFAKMLKNGESIDIASNTILLDREAAKPGKNAVQQGRGKNFTSACGKVRGVLYCYEDEKGHHHATEYLGSEEAPPEILTRAKVKRLFKSEHKT